MERTRAEAVGDGWEEVVRWIGVEGMKKQLGVRCGAPFARRGCRMGWRSCAITEKKGK